MPGSDCNSPTDLPGNFPSLSPAPNAAHRWFIIIPPEGAARTAALHTAEAFTKALGSNAVARFDTATYLAAFTSLLAAASNDMVVDMLNQSMIVQALDFGASRILVPALSPVTLFSLNLLRKLGVVTIHWFYEDYRRAHYWRDIVSGYDVFLGIQRGELESTCTAAGARFGLLPTAVPSSLIVNESSNRDVDIAFVGTPSSYRVRILEALQRSGFSLRIGGSGWAEYRGPLKRSIAISSWVDDTHGTALLRQARIVVNVSNTDPASDRDNTHLSPRVFEAMAHGCVLITEDVPLAHTILSGYTYHVFTSDQELIRVVGQTLECYDSERTGIEENKRKIAASDTYECRVSAIMRMVEAMRPALRQW